MRRIALLVTVGMAACGGGIDQGTDSAESMAQATADANRQAITSEQASVSTARTRKVDRNVRGTSVARFFPRNNPDCVGRLPVGPIVRSHYGFYLATGTICFER